VSPSGLDGKPVLLNTDSLTSIFLLKVLLSKRFGVRPQYRYGEVDPAGSFPEDVDGILMIGDPALRARGRLPHILDLGQGWKDLTGFPFVFAVWAVRREFYLDHREKTHRLHHALLRSKRYSLARLDEICDAVYQRVELTREACSTYLKERLSFDLTPRHLEGLGHFLRMLEEEGEFALAPQLEFIDAD
jgi:chorismate dehydratase